MIDHEELMRYLDGELAPDRVRAVEEALERSTELKRELMLFRTMKHDLREVGTGMRTTESVWTNVNRRLTRPVGWILLVAGVAVWVAYGAYTFLTSGDALWEKVALSAVIVGMAILLLSAFVDRHHDLKTDPYKEIER